MSEKPRQERGFLLPALRSVGADVADEVWMGSSGGVIPHLREAKGLNDRSDDVCV